MLQIKDKRDCTGCHACATICPVNCISMVSDADGFWYPEIDHAKCTRCGKCVDVCLVINMPVVEDDPVAYACLNVDDTIRLASSSGGIFTALAEQVIEDGGVVFGAGFNGAFEVEHGFTESLSGLGLFRGSEYVQSRIGWAYRQVKEFLQLGRKVLFTGTPCQVSGLKSYLGASHHNLISVDLACKGVPSPKVWRIYVEYREKEAGAMVTNVAFRRKDSGWRRSSLSFSFGNGREYRKTLDQDPYMRAFLANVCLRPSCHACRFKGVRRHGDFTLADFRGVRKVLPEMDDDQGTSLVFVSNASAFEMFENLKGSIIRRKVDIHQALVCNQAVLKSVRCSARREEFFRALHDVSLPVAVQKVCPTKKSANIRQAIKWSLVALWRRFRRLRPISCRLR